MKTLRIIIVIIASIFSAGLYSQDSIWPRVFKGERVRDIIHLYDNGFILVGTVNQQYQPDFDYGILKKVDVDGKQLWQKYIGAVPSPGLTMIDEIFPTNDNGYVIAGFTRMYNGAGLTFAMKLNSCFEKEWSHVFYSGEGNQASSGIVQTVDGNYLLTINYWGGDPNKNIWVFKLSTEGNIIWKKSFADEWEPGPWSGEISNDFIPDNTGDYIISGEYWKDQPGTGYLWVRPMFVRIDTAGNEDWGLVYGVEDFFVGQTYGTTADSQGTIYSAGLNRGNPSVSNNEPLALFKVSTEGEMVWAVDLNQPEDSVHLGFHPDVSIMDDTLLFATGCWTTIDSELNTEVFKLDTSGNLLDRKLLSDLSYLPVHSTVTEDKKICIVSSHFTGEPPGFTDIHLFKVNSDLQFDTLYNQAYTYDSLCDHEIVSDTIPLDSLTVNLDELSANLQPISVFPNPANDLIKVEINIVKWKERKLLVSDLSGTEIYNSNIPPGKANHELNVSGWKEGLYVFRLYEGGDLLQTEKVLVLH